jgi:hypothetical protein
MVYNGGNQLAKPLLRRNTMYTLKAINSDSDTCETCGKSGLKRVMWLEVMDEDGNSTGTVIPMGTCCGAKALGLNGHYNTVEQVAEAAQSKQKLAAIIEDAKKLALQYNDEIAVIKSGNDYYTVRGKAFDANPSRYGMPVRWVTK